MKLVSWNVKGSWSKGSSVVPAQARKLLGAEPDLIALQELRRNRLPEWEAHFTRAAMQTGHQWHVRHTCDFVDGRTNFVLVASRWPFVAVERPHRFEVPFFERVLSARSTSTAGRSS